MTCCARQNGGSKQAKALRALSMRINLAFTVSQCIADLELIAQASEPHEWLNRTVYLPLK